MLIVLHAYATCQATAGDCILHEADLCQLVAAEGQAAGEFCQCTR